MWLLPSRGRPQLLPRMFATAPPTAPGIVGVDEDQVGLYGSVALPPNWGIEIFPRLFVPQKLNAMVERCPGEPWYGIICDDQPPQTKDWDITLPEAAGPWGVSWADDCLHKRIGACVFGGELVRALGWICEPSLRHFYTDDIHEMIVAEFKIGVPRMDVKIPHLHFTTGKTAYDKTYAERPNHAECKAEFEAWKVNGWPILRERLKAALPSSA